MAPKKHLGQHFLTSPAYARRIAESVPAAPGDRVVEIGPGHGALSIFLKERFPEFHLVEIDPDVIVRLKEKLGEGRFTLHRADVLKFDFANVGFPLHAVGNLPYSIGALIIKKCLLLGGGLRSCTFMVQREVAERIVAKPTGKTNGFLSIFCQYFGAPRILFHVPPGSFFPRPKVDSSVFQLVIDPRATERLVAGERAGFFSFVSNAFSQRRKKLPNAVGRTPGDRDRCAGLLREIGIDENARPENLGVGEWIALYKRWHS
jgi:16S rRNA (adenine1518-N6/adenine1519-N6)-dimethyltransferase